MPKLIQYALHEIGHPDVRFYNLRVPFTNKETEQPDHTYNALDNAGGKSTQIHIFFSQIVTNLKFYNRGGSASDIREINSYFQPGDVSWVVSEWTIDNAQMKLDGPPSTRIIGYVGHKPKVANEQGRHPLKRRFFSFVTSDSLSFDSLPIGKTPTYQEALQWLAVSKKDHPKLDWVLTDNQGEWSEALRARRFYPGIYRLMAEMNFQESNPFSAFKVSTPIEFFDIVLQALADSDAGKSLFESLNQNFDEWARRFEYENEHNWLDVIHKEMQRMVEPAEALVKIEAETKEHSKKRSELAEKALKTVNYYENEKKICDDEIGKWRGKEGDLKGKHKQLQAELNWLKFHYRQVAVQMQQERVDSAQEAIDMAKYALALYVAAEICRDLENLETSIKAKQEAFEDLSKPAKELAKKLNALGYVWHQRLEAKLKVIERQIADKRGLIRELREDQNKKLGKRGDISRQIDGLKQSVAEIDEWLKKQNEALSALRQDQVVNDDESASESLSRLSLEVEAIENKIAVFKANIEDLAEEKLELNVQRAKVESQADEHRSSIKNLKKDIDQYQRSESALSLNNDLCRIEQTEKVVLFDAHLPGRIDDYLSHLETEKSQHRMRHDSLVLRLELLEKHDVMPPSKDVRNTLDFLEARNISAFTYGQYFADNIQVPIDTIRKIYLQDPSKTSSIVFQSGDDFNRAKEIVQLDTISFPVQLVLETDFPTLDPSYKAESKRHVIMPSSDAGFNRDAATDEKSTTSKKIETAANGLEKIEAELRAIRSARNDLESFLGQYTSDYHLKQEGALSDTEHILEQVLYEADNNERLLKENEERHTTAKRDLKEYEDKLPVYNDFIKRVREYITRYDENIERKVRDRKNALVESEDLDKQIREIERDIEQSANREKKAQDESDGLKSERTTFKNTKREIEHKNRNKGSNIESLLDKTDEFIIASYKDTHDMYRAERDNNAKLSAEIDLLRKTASEKSDELDSASKGLDLDEVRIVSQDGRFEFGPKAKTLLGDAVIDSKVAFESAKKDHAAALKEKEKFVGNFGVPDRPESYTDDLTIKQASQLIKDLQDVAENTQAQIVEVQKSIYGLSEQKGQAKDKCKNIKTVASSMEEFKSLVLHEQEKCYDTADTFSEEYTAISEKGKVIDKEQKRIQFRVDTLNSKIDNRVNDDTYPNITKSFKERLSRLRTRYHVDTKEHVDTINERMLSLKDTIDKNEDRRQRLLDLFLTEVQHYIGKLLDIEKTSKMPAMQGFWRLWSNRRFIRVKAEKRVRDSNFVRQKLEMMIERFFSKDQRGRFASGFKLIQEGVHAVLMNNVKIKVLKYHDVPTTKRFDIEKASQFSGGQRAVTGIICFIAISRLVSASQKGMGENPSILLLDNPTGSLSKSSFIQQAIETANFSNVQLIFYSALLEPSVAGQFDVYNTFRTNKINARDEMVVERVMSDLPEDQGKSHPMIQATFINREVKQTADAFGLENQETT